MILYGYEAKPRNDPFVKIAEDAMKGFSRASEPGAFLVDRFPIRTSMAKRNELTSDSNAILVRWLPEWLPGGSFKRIAREMREELDSLYDEPFDFVKREMVRELSIPARSVLIPRRLRTPRSRRSHPTTLKKTPISQKRRRTS